MTVVGLDRFVIGEVARALGAGPGTQPVEGDGPRRELQAALDHDQAQLVTLTQRRLVETGELAIGEPEYGAGDASISIVAPSRAGARPVCKLFSPPPLANFTRLAVLGVLRLGLRAGRTVSRPWGVGMLPGRRKRRCSTDNLARERSTTKWPHFFCSFCWQ